MNFSLGVFDVFANAIPGALQMSVFYYMALRAGWLSGDEIGNSSSLLVLALGFAASTIMGHLIYPYSQRISYWTARRQPRFTDRVREEFKRDNPQLAGRPFLDADSLMLLGALRIKNPEAASDIARLKATGIMLRSSLVPLATAAFVAFIEIFASDEHLLAALLSVAFAVGSLTALKEGQTHAKWALKLTFEHAAWVSGIDEPYRSRPSPPPTG